jgi:acyl-CoA synthetase (AMP-forming)/AMP-acid ligase II
VNGWLHTGDVGYFDGDGYLTLVDRIKDLIMRGGENAYPKEIESAIYTNPEVSEAAVVGDPTPCTASAVVGRPNPVYGECRWHSSCRGTAMTPRRRVFDNTSAGCLRSTNCQTSC